VILAHDIGTTGDKASLHSDDGRLVKSLTVRYETQYGRGGVVEQQPSDWFDAFSRATRDLLEATGTAAREVEVVCFSGQMMGVVLLGADGEPVRPALIWADTRSTAQCSALVDRVGAERGYRILGHRLNPTYSLSKLMWIREAEPDVFGAARKVCLAKDYIAFRLTGVLATDPSDASSTNAFDQRAGAWSDELLGAADVSPKLFPQVVPSTTVLGSVTPIAAERTGLTVGTRVVLGGGDGPLAAVGAGVVTPADGAYLYLGSSSWVSVSADQPLLDLPQMRTMTFNHVVPGQYVPTATMQAGGGSLAWISELLEAADPAQLNRLLDNAAHVEAAAEGLYFLPHLLGERSPYWNPAARGAFVGIARHHGPAHLTRAVLEGVAFNLATCVHAFREAGLPITTVDAVGGGAVSDVWLQIIVDVWGTTVRRRSVVEEANSLGAAVTGGVGAGLIDDFSAARTLSQVTAEYKPATDRHAEYAGRHTVFRELYDRIEPWFPDPQQ
jgi:xylulokinase